MLTPRDKLLALLAAKLPPPRAELARPPGEEALDIDDRTTGDRGTGTVEDPPEIA